MPREYVARLISSKKPFAARNWLKTLRGLMQFAVTAGLRPDDPMVGIGAPKARAGTIHTWTEAEIAQFEARHEIGSRPRLAMALLLYTAARRGNAIGLGPQHVRNGMLSYRQQKTGRTLKIPLHPELAMILASRPSYLSHDGNRRAVYSRRFRQCVQGMVQRSRLEALQRARATQGASASTR